MTTTGVTSPNILGILKKICIVVLVVAAAAIVASIAINAYCILSTRDDVHTIAQIESDDMQADAIVVLGASVKPDGSPSDMLADRLEVAADLYLSGAAPAVIASGDNRTSHYNESEAMKDYMVELGVPSSAIYVDHAGYDTYASVYRAKYVFGANSIMVVTQAYHLYRSLMIGNMLGMNVTGVAADKGGYYNQALYSLREVVARDKDFFMSLLRLPPEEPTQQMTM